MALLRVIVILGPRAHVVRIWVWSEKYVGQLCVKLLHRRERGRIRTVDRGWDRDGARATGIDVTKRERKRLNTVGSIAKLRRYASATGTRAESGTRWNSVRERVLIEEDVVMCGLARAEQPRVAE